MYSVIKTVQISCKNEMQYDEIGVQNKAFKIDKGVDSYNNR